ncbi:MAG TPA: carbohydrate ABC transporter permease, partial [Thermodesulfobacteriota bacterium]|nr:carbohydrate ABC transporter permease [Thermodesulfobacteriota bacterium]
MKRAIIYILLGVVSVYCLFPFLWTILTALKPQEEVFKLPIRYLPERISLQNLKSVFYKRPFTYYILNSLLVAGGATLFTLWAASLIAFRLRKMEIERSLKIQRWLLIMAIVPPALLVIPVFMAMKKLGLVNHYLGLILPYVALNLPFAIWMLHAAFRQLPKELDEAAMLDGFSSFRILLGIILPLSRPALSVAGVVVFIFCWNEFILALTLMPSQVRYTVPVGIAMLSGTSVYEIPWGEINAAVALTTLPVFLLMALFQRW